MNTPETLNYFWTEYGDIERWVDFDRERLAIEFPAILKSWDDYKTSRLVLDAVLRDSVLKAQGDE